MKHSSAHGYTNKHDATYIQVKEGKLWASDMVKDSYYYDGAMEAFNHSFIEVGNPERLKELVWKYGEVVQDGLYPVNNLQFNVKEECSCFDCQSCDNRPCEYPQKVAILSLKQEQPKCEDRCDWPNCTMRDCKDKQEQPSEEKEIPAYEYCSVICDTIDDLLTQGGVRPLDRSVGLMMKIASNLKTAGFRIIKD